MIMELTENICDKIKAADTMLLWRVMENFQSRLQDSHVLDST
jgi:hypothetical protein